MADLNPTAPADATRYTRFLTTHDTSHCVGDDLGDGRIILLDKQAPALALASILRAKADMLHGLVDYAATAVSEAWAPEALAGLLLPFAEEVATMAEVLQSRLRDGTGAKQANHEAPL